MPVDPATRRAADAIRARAQALATAPVGDGPDQDAELLSGLAAGSLSLAEVDDDALERLVGTHGTDALVRAILSTGNDATVGNRLPKASTQGRDERRPANILSFRRRLVAGGNTRWLAAAAAIFLAIGVGTVVSRYFGGAQTGTDTPGTQARDGREPSPGNGPSPPNPSIIPTQSPTRTAVLIQADDPMTTSLAEATILRALSSGQGLQALDENGVSQLRGNSFALDRALQDDFGPIAEIGRRLGLEVLVVGDLKSRAAPSAGPDYAGTAELRLTMYRLSTGRIVDSKTFVVGPDAAAETAVDEAKARLHAAEKAVGEAVGVVRSWLLP
jgi:hypothetical protein